MSCNNRDNAINEDSMTIEKWKRYTTRTKESIYEKLDEREKFFLICVVETFEDIGFAPHEEISARLFGRHPKLFSNQSDVDEVERQLCEKNVLLLVRGSSTSVYSVRPTDDIMAVIGRGPLDLKKDGTVEFHSQMPSWNIFFHMESSLVILIKSKYHDLTQKEIFILKHIIFAMIDGMALAVLPEYIIGNLHDVDTIFDDMWEDVIKTLNLLLSKKIIRLAYAGYESVSEDSAIIRTMPQTYFILEEEFAREAVSMLNYLYFLNYTNRPTRRNQYLVSKSFISPVELKVVETIDGPLISRTDYVSDILDERSEKAPI